MLCRRATLDVIGLTAFGYDFGAVEHVRGGGQGDGAGEGKAPNTDIMGFWTDILAPAMLLAFNLPLPDALVPGYQGFVRGVAKLDLVVDEMLAKHRAGDVAGPQSGRSILGAMLDAQAAGNALVTDKQIRDELQTFLLAGADTTAVTLSFCLWELSRHPAGLSRAQAEVDAVVTADGRAADAPITADDVAKMPYVCGCISEALRMYSAATDSARLVKQDCVIGGHFVPGGTLAILNLWALHR